MTDYKNLKLIATSSPHIRAAENTRSIMLDVIVAMLPALAWAVWTFGFKALTLTVVSVAGCMFWEWLYRNLMHKPQSVGDLSAVVTGMLLAFVSPVTTPYWMILIGGSLGEVSALCLILGGAYLIWRKVINWQTPVGYIGTVAVLTFLFPKAGSNVEWMLYSLFGGGLMLGAFFMATDYATSPVTKKGQLVFGIGCGLFTVFIRYFGSYNEGVCYSIMVMNLCVALIDKYTKPTRFGVVKSDKKEAAAK